MQTEAKISDKRARSRTSTTGRLKESLSRMTISVKTKARDKSPSERINTGRPRKHWN